MRPQEEQPQWRGSSGNLDSAPAGTPSAGPGGSGAGPLICSAGAGASSLSWALPASACPGGGRILGCVPAPCAPEPALVDSRSRAAQPPPRSRRPSPSELLLEPRSPLRTEPLPLPEPGRAAPGPRSPLRGAAPEPLRAAPVPPGPAVRAAALRDLGALSWARSCCYCPREPEGIPALLGPAPPPREPLSPGKVGAAPASPGRGSPVLGTLAPASARLLAGPSPSEAFVSLFLFPRLPTLIEARTLLPVASAVFSLNLRPNS